MRLSTNIGAQTYFWMRIINVARSHRLGQKQRIGNRNNYFELRAVINRAVPLDRRHFVGMRRAGGIEVTLVL